MAQRKKRSGYLAGELAEDPRPKKRKLRSVKINGQKVTPPVSDDDVLWIAFHKDAFKSLGTRTEQGFKLTFEAVNIKKWPNGLTSAELQVTATDDGMVLAPKIALPSEKKPTSLLDRLGRKMS